MECPKYNLMVDVKQEHSVRYVFLLGNVCICFPVLGEYYKAIIKQIYLAELRDSLECSSCVPLFRV